MKLVRFIFIPAVLYLLAGFVTAAYAQWEPDRRLTFNDSSSRTSFNNAWCVATEGMNVHVVWFDKRDGNWEIYYKPSPDSGTTWLSDVRLTTDPDSSEFPSISVSGPLVHVVWQDFRDGNWEVYYKRSTDRGASWSFPDVRLTSDSSQSLYPSLAVSGLTVHLVWEDHRNGKGDAFYKRSTDGGLTWGNDTCLSISSDTVSRPSVAVADSGVHVAWLGKRTSQSQVYYKRSTDGGFQWPFPDTDLTNAPTGRAVYNPSIAASDSFVLVVWSDDRGVVMGSSPVAKSSTSGGQTWGSDTVLSRDWGVVTGFGSPSVAVRVLNAHVVWAAAYVIHPPYQDYILSLILYNQTGDGGAHWLQDTVIFQSENAFIKGDCSIASSDFGVHVISRDHQDGNYEIHYQRDLIGPSGVEVLSPSRLPPHVLLLKVSPNPFTSFASVPGHSSDRFALYDVSGRKVGVYKGDRIGEGLAPGVYFLKPAEQGSKPIRIVKLR